jgi:hypothetical protein
MSSQELSVSEAEFRDYQARSGTPFKHEQNLSELTDLRNRLRATLSGVEMKEKNPQRTLPGGSRSCGPTIQGNPRRSGRRAIAAEEPWTARIRRRAGAETTTGPAMEPDHDASSDACLDILSSISSSSQNMRRYGGHA